MQTPKEQTSDLLIYYIAWCPIAFLCGTLWVPDSSVSPLIAPYIDPFLWGHAFLFICLFGIHFGPGYFLAETILFYLLFWPGFALFISLKVKHLDRWTLTYTMLILPTIAAIRPTDRLRAWEMQPFPYRDQIEIIVGVLCILGLVIILYKRGISPAKRTNSL